MFGAENFHGATQVLTHIKWHDKRCLKIHKTSHPNQGREVIPALPPMLPNRPTYVRAIGRNPSQFIIGHSRMEFFSLFDRLAPSASSLSNISLELPFIMLRFVICYCCRFYLFYLHLSIGYLKNTEIQYYINGAKALKIIRPNLLYNLTFRHVSRVIYWHCSKVFRKSSFTCNTLRV